MSPVDDLFARLERERQDADRRYNDALSALDRAIQQRPALPEPPPAVDDARVAALNGACDILPDGAPVLDRSLKGRLRAFVWRLVGPPLETQKRFNALLVEHLNRNLPGLRQSHDTLVALGDLVGRELDAVVRFESLLVQYLQTITAYVDTRDRASAAGDLRERVALAEQRIAALKREVDRASRGDEPRVAATAPPPPAFAGAVDSAIYVGFEDRFRGSQAEIRSRVSEYVDLLASASDVLDVGCGRGELLDLLRARGVRARGIDSNTAMVALCKLRGLEVQEADAVGYLEQLDDQSLGGLVAVQVVEHFEPAYLLRFLETAHHRLRPGSPVILETINAACWMAFFETYIRDLTHQRPLHPDTLKYLVEASGFTAVDVRYRAPVAERDRLTRVAAPDDVLRASPALAGLVEVVNAHADALNARLFSSMDYAVIARR